MKLDLDKLDLLITDIDKYEKKWGHNFSETPEYKYLYPILPLGSKLPLLKLIQGKHRLLFNQCPNCNSSAPKLYDCPVCENDRYIFYYKPKQMVKELKILTWNRYKYLLNQNSKS